MMRLFLLIATFLSLVVYCDDPMMMTTMGYKANVRLNPFANMPQPNYYLLEGATVSIEFGYVSGYDQLFVDYQGAFPITGKFNPSNGVLYLTGEAPISEYAVAIASVVFLTTSEDGDQRMITYTFGNNTLYMSSTHHFYKYVPSPLAWSQAVLDCSQRWYMGMQGYLATITWEDEMSQVGGKATYSAWLGASDVTAANNWVWVTGPEGQENWGQGRKFWQGLSIYQGGQPTNWLSFDQWYRFQPDDGNGKNQSFLSLVNTGYQGIAYFADSSNVDGVQGFICEFGGMDSAPIANTYWWYTGSVQLQLDCSLFDSQTECQNRNGLGCSWSVGRCATINCGRYPTQQRCVTDWRCQWAIDADIGICTETACGKYSDSVTCSADPTTCSAKVVSGSTQCRPARCGDQMYAYSCNSLAGCAFRSGTCVHTISADCSGMDIVYLLDGTETMAQAFDKYTSGFFALAQLFVDGDFALTGLSAGASVTSATFGQRIGVAQYGPSNAQVSPSSIGSGGRLTGSRRELSTDLQWHQQVYTASVVTRDVMGGLSAAKSMFQPSNGRQQVLVIFAAGLIDDAQAISNQAKSSPSTSVLAQLWQQGVRIIGVPLRPTEPQTPDSVAAWQSLALLTSNLLSVTMEESFTQQIFTGLCGNQTQTIGQFVTKTAFGEKCSDYTSIDWCNKQTVCAWNPATLSCVNSGCTTYPTQTDCVNDPSCAFNGQFCIQKCPSKTMAECQGLTGICWWNTAMNFCDNAPCVSNPNEDACIGDLSKCSFSPKFATGCKITPCQYSDETTCRGDIANSCTWYMGICYMNTCTGLNSNDCINAVNCVWDTNQTVASCRLNYCGRYTVEQSCQSDRACAWNVGVVPASCGPNPCRYFNNPEIPKTISMQWCAADSQCYWQSQAENGFADMCIVKTCDSLKRSCDCAAMTGCVWRNNQCKDSTFVQCPSIDAVFLVESTSYMQRAFGRHPSGFIGIVEAIRTWSWSAPLSASSLSTGFRLGIVGYGDPNIPMQASTAVGAHGNITGDIDAWAKVGQELDDFERQQAKYATNAGGNVAIRKGLEAALGLFRKVQGDVNRKKMLIVIGAQAITDGQNSLNQIVAEIEAMNVQIFTNVIRRFSSITPLDQVAATFLGPMASDPPQLHFMFNTIDQMQSSLLDNFCDPSTNTGKVLQISREGTLPCNWLTGSNECNIQGSCWYNSSAVPTCPLPGQCANLGCVALPLALTNMFECSNCLLVSGAFQCSRSKNYAPAAGLCVLPPCMTSGCTAASCSGTSCWWNAGSVRCERSMCQATLPTSCNPDLGCVWIDSGANPSNPTRTGCVRSLCGVYRESTTCSAVTIAGKSGDVLPCGFLETLAPAICHEKRCPNYNKVNCDANPVQCVWNAVLGSCTELMCQHSTNEQCETDVNCYWDPFNRLPGQFGTCKQRVSACVLSGYGPWSGCTSSCGPVAIRYQSRTILQPPAPGGQTCLQVAALTGALLVTQSCTTQTNWPSDCVVYCATLPLSSCIVDLSCMWKNQQCVKRPFPGCSSQTTALLCNAQDMCDWMSAFNICVETVKVCQYPTEATCNTITKCMWRTGASANAIAKSVGVNSLLINPGQLEVYIFPQVAVNDDTLINGATVTIESNYQRGKDILELTFPTTIVATWLAASGTLMLSGLATRREFAAAIRFVTFYTTSTRGVSRNITWSLGLNTMFSLSTGHYYRSYQQSSGIVSWEQAKSLCAATSQYGLQGYLATVTSDAENGLISGKLAADGWISGDDLTRGVWQWSTGPEVGQTFWRGASVIAGGYPAQGQYANWNQMNGEPTSVSSGFNHPYVNQSGFWSSKADGYSSARGFVCEFGGQIGDIPSVSYAFGGGVVIGIGGCVPTTSCGWHTSQAACTLDSECLWATDVCISGCGVRSTVGECDTGTTSQCKWDTTVLPPQCDLNECLGLGQTACGARNRCVWSAESGCRYKTGCAQYSTQGQCNVFSSCIWTIGTQTCDTRPCSTLKSSQTCAANPLCSWSDDYGCSTVVCKYGTSAECTSDQQCTWSQSDAASAGFFAGGARITPFSANTQAPNDITTTIDGITIAITEGFQNGQDVLSVSSTDNQAGNFVVTWNPTTGVLILAVAPGVRMNALSGFRFMQATVKFYSSSNSLVRRQINYVLSLGTIWSPSAQGFLKYNGSTASTFAQAQAICQSSSLFGVPGVVASIWSQNDNLRLAAVGAQGWIAATSSDSGTTWKWNGNVTFWTGVGAVGAPAAGQYAQWAVGEPKSGSTNAFVTRQTTAISVYTTWRSIAASGANPGPGVICQYGSAAQRIPVVINGVRAAKPQGCFTTPCLGLPQATCATSPQCTWASSATGSSCVVETFCTAAVDIQSCVTRELCYWDYNYATCRSAPDNFCRSQNAATCGDYTQCNWNTNIIPRDSGKLGSCVFKGCAVNPTEDSCTANALCRWDPPSNPSGQCVARLCGYRFETQCWDDKLCQWSATNGVCGKSSCYGTSCTTTQCRLDTASGICAFKRCASSTLTACIQDTSCLFQSSACFQPSCATIFAEKDCNANKQCYYAYSPNRCTTAQCIVWTTKVDCEKTVGGSPQCKWDVSGCRELDIYERNAPSSSGSCEKEVEPNLWWLWLLLVLIVGILATICYRLYLAYSKGLSFFDAGKKNVKYSPHQQYAAELAEESVMQGQESNAPYQRVGVSVNDL